MRAVIKMAPARTNHWIGCLTSSRAVTDKIFFTAHVGWLKVLGFSEMVFAPGTADDMAPLLEIQQQNTCEGNSKRKRHE